MADRARIKVASLAKVYRGKVTSVDDLVAALDRDRFEAIFILLREPGLTPTWMEQAGHKVFYLSHSARTRTFRPSSLLRLVRILRSNRVQVLHCHNHRANLYGVLAGILARTPVILVQFHGLGRARTLWRKCVNVLVLRRATRVLSVSQAVQRDVVATNWGVPARKLFVLEDSVDYARFANCELPKEEGRRLLGMPSDATVFSAVGRLVPTKGLRYLIEAFGRVREQIPTAHLVLIGDGQERTRLERQAAATAHGRAIHFLGYRDDVEQCFRGMDVFVLSSLAEGVGRVLLEAMAAGVPAVATRVGGIPEVIDDPSTGLLVPPRDAAALAEAMIRVACLSEAQRQAMASAARERVRQRYSHEVIREKLRRLYEDEFEACAGAADATPKEAVPCPPPSRTDRGLHP